MRTQYIFLFILISIITGIVAVNLRNVEHEAELRIENELKLNIPESAIDSVWSFMLDEYSNEDLFLSAYDETYSTEFKIEQHSDLYFDNERLTLLKNKSGIRYREKHRKKNDQQTEIEEEVQVKIDDVSPEEETRGEYQFDVKRYNDDENEALDDHPLFGLIKRDERDALKGQLQEFEMVPSDINAFITLKQDRRRMNIIKENDTYITVTIDRVTAIYDTLAATFSEIEIELNEKVYTKADDADREEMEEVREVILNDLVLNFPSLEQDQTPKYNKAYQELKKIASSFDRNFKQ